MEGKGRDEVGERGEPAELQRLVKGVSNEHEPVLPALSGASSTATIQALAAGTELGAWRNVFVRNIPRDWDERKLARVFSTCGEVESTTVLRHLNTGLSRGIGYVQYIEHAAAVRAVARLSGLDAASEELCDDVDLDSTNGADGFETASEVEVGATAEVGRGQHEARQTFDGQGPGRQSWKSFAAAVAGTFDGTCKAAPEKENDGGLQSGSDGDNEVENRGRFSAVAEVDAKAKTATVTTTTKTKKKKKKKKKKKSGANGVLIVCRAQDRAERELSRRQRLERVRNGMNLFVRNLSVQCTEKDLEHHFSCAGFSVVGCTVSE